MTFCIGPAMSHSLETSAPSKWIGPVELDDTPTSGSGSATVRPGVSRGTAIKSWRSVAEPRSTKVAASTNTSAVAPPVTHGDMPCNRNPPSIASAVSTGAARCLRLVVRCEMPTVANNSPPARPGNKRCLSSSFSDPAILRQAPVRCVIMNVVVRQAVLAQDSREQPAPHSNPVRPKQDRETTHTRHARRTAATAPQATAASGPTRSPFRLAAYKAEPILDRPKLRFDWRP